MISTPPEAFKRMCQNFGPDLAEFAPSINDLVEHALIGIDRNDARAIGSFLDELLNGKHSAEDIKKFWWSMPVTTVFHDGKDVINMLERIREAVARRPFTD